MYTFKASVHPVKGKTESGNALQPASFGNFDDWRIKSSPKDLKFCRHDHEGLVIMSTEGIDESLHGLGGIEEFRAKTGVFFGMPRTSIRVNS